MDKKLLTIIVPCYNEEESLPIFYKTVHEMEDKLSSVDWSLCLWMMAQRIGL